MKDRLNWQSRLGFILAGAGAAIGLGAIWKFPYMAGSNGGSAFLFPYVLMSLTIGFTLLLAEVTLGRMGRGSIVTTFRKIGGRRLVPWGYFGVITGFCVLCFYSAIGGWTISYLFDAIFSPGFLSDKAGLAKYFGNFVSSPKACVGSQIAFIAITAGTVAFGVNEGIERLGKVLMPLLLVLVLGIIGWSFTLPNAIGGLEYLFRWNPSAFTLQSLLMAMGFTFFSLCVGCGCMLTYGSYLGLEENLPASCASIVVLTTLSSILGGLLVMPAVFAFGLDPASGPMLTFITMPFVFAQFSFGQVLSIVFFLCLLCAAITSSVSMLELLVAFLVDEKHMTRQKACLLSSIALILVGSCCALSFGELKDVRFLGRTCFENFDYFTSNLGLPLGGLLVCYLAGKKLWTPFKEELARGGHLSERRLLALRFFTLVVSPALILTVLCTGL